MQKQGRKGTAWTISTLILLLIATSVLTWSGTTAAQAAPVYNVRDYGAVGDGSHDDSGAIQAAINAVDSSVGGTVYVPQGVYRVRYGAYGGDTTLNLKSNMTFQMDAGAELRMDGTNSSRYNLLHAGNVSNVTITGGTITGDRDQHQGTGGESGFNISTFNGRNILISGVTSRKAWADGIYIDGWENQVTDGVRVENCVLDSNRRQGISIICGRNITITGSVMSNTEGAMPMAGLDLEPWNPVQVIENVVVSYNTFRNNDCGFEIGGSQAPVKNITVTGNTIEQSRNHGMWIDTVSDVTITGNNIVGPAPNWGIDLLGAVRATVDSNNISGFGMGGVYITRGYNSSQVSNNNAITNNYVTNNSGPGVAIGGGSYTNWIIGNTLLGNSQPIHIGDATDTVIQGNITEGDPGNIGSFENSWYLAEGYTGPGFKEYISLGNPGSVPAYVLITYMFENGGTRAQFVAVPPLSRMTVDVNAAAGEGLGVAAEISSDQQVVVERPMYFNYRGWTDGTVATATATPSPTWYFAEGYTGAGFEEYICVLNPGPTAANVTFRFQTQEQGEVVRSGYQVAPFSRSTWKAGEVLGRGFQNSLKIESDQPIVAERPIYFTYAGPDGAVQWSGGTNVMGVPELATQYYFAEGTTRDGFDEYLTLQNPNAQDIEVSATYQLGEGQGENVTESYSVPAGSRHTVLVRDAVGSGKDVSVLLASGSQFLAERPMYFRYTAYGADWDGGHCVVGTPAARAEWYFAEGTTLPGFHQYLSIQNPGDTPAVVEVVFMTQEEGALAAKTVTVAPRSRMTSLVNDMAGAGYQLSTRMRVTSGPPIVVERSMYFDLSGMSGGHATIGQ
ncbi:MAG: DUF5719 family protein [Candidatus Geothermincolia bacterium]